MQALILSLYTPHCTQATIILAELFNIYWHKIGIILYILFSVHWCNQWLY